MPLIKVVVESAISQSVRARQLGGMFDVPMTDKSRLEWTIDAPLEAQPWKVGLIVGPSGSGKSTIGRHLFGDLMDRAPTWGAPSVIDDFDPSLSMQQISEVCSAVGFNTIPAWLRRHAVLSNGEKFRVELARRLIEERGLVVFDEFTSVVDRQVAKIGAHAVQRYVRRQEGQQFVAISCHEDIEDWLQPDWVIEPATQTFRRRSLQRRPPLDVTVSPVPRPSWELFAPFHYLTANMHRNARCWCLFVGDRPAAFAGMLFRPAVSPDSRIMAVSRLVVLPDFQGLGLAFQLVDRVAAIYMAAGFRTRTYPAHPALVRSFDRSPAWALIKHPGKFSNPGSSTSAEFGAGDRARSSSMRGRRIRIARRRKACCASGRTHPLSRLSGARKNARGSARNYSHSSFSEKKPFHT